MVSRPEDLFRNYQVLNVWHIPSGTAEAAFGELASTLTHEKCPLNTAYEGDIAAQEHLLVLPKTKRFNYAQTVGKVIIAHGTPGKIVAPTARFNKYGEFERLDYADACAVRAVEPDTVEIVHGRFGECRDIQRLSSAHRRAEYITQALDEVLAGFQGVKLPSHPRRVPDGSSRYDYLDAR